MILTTQLSCHLKGNVNDSNNICDFDIDFELAKQRKQYSLFLFIFATIQLLISLELIVCLMGFSAKCSLANDVYYQFKKWN